MTQATAVRDRYLPQTAPKIHYQVAIREPESHLFEVSLTLQNWQLQVLDLKMPVWTPGSYLVREYSKHLQNFSAYSGDQPLTWRKLSKNHWQVDTNGVSQVTVNYRVFANELTVRTNHLDATHGYFNSAALLFYIPEFEQQPLLITIVPPRPEWHITTPLQVASDLELPILDFGSGDVRQESESVESNQESDYPKSIIDNRNTFLAPDFDTLVDSPFEIGTHQLYHFEVMGKPHELAIWGKGNAEAERMIPDMQKIIEVEAQLYGGLPYDRYVFLLHLASTGAGGLEHKNSCTLNYHRFGFREPDKYNRFMQLVAHEFFHLWNVKRIRPKALEVFDYTGENYTPSLWFSEGTTSYYDLVIPFRAGIYDIKSFLNELGKEITRLQTTPGRLVQPASESSFDAWIKLYRPDANSGNSQISYYLKGEMVSFLLDLLIRARHENKRSLDDVMRKMWQQFGQDEVGFTPEELQQVIESVAGTDLQEFFARYVDGTDELPFDEYLSPFGLRLVGEKEEPVAYLGVTAKTENGREMLKFVEAGSPAQLAGIDAGDELLAIDGFRVTAQNLSDRLKDYNPGNTIQVTVFHQDELRTSLVTLAEPRPTSYKIVPVESPDDTQKQNFAGWLGSN
ncbi:M61 family metallopeptidase [Funiculus sociatus GB2-A5]|uniref:M61 family metallopeptidase n=1 Tax=Funiculus sociatus GB2-A5 TaxID=2933946 RepID=A0ABV0JPF9_9CYAN|nr:MULTISPECIES: M61 family metallopeptidase [unclassified Trichocoleus]MBD1907749.1 M61 family metallopeptidase [Trichocoleus sp. FACHB-832]MBD2065166.1 M61 family metallopeptidase [Trichocoleus sp. FACHB-6]